MCGPIKDILRFSFLKIDNKVAILLRSLFSLSSITLQFLSAVKITVSSAYNKIEQCFSCKSISFIKSINNNGPSIDPCGTPHTTDFLSEEEFSIDTNCFDRIDSFQTS